jgi:prolyl oligopeptidase
VQEKNFVYPRPSKDDISEDFHGTVVADPYRWLEDPDSPATLDWVAAENELSQAFLSSAQAHPKIKARLTELWDYERYGLPHKQGRRYFFSKNDGLQNQDVVYMQERLDGPAIEVLDPNKFSADGTVALANLAFSDDGKFLAYGMSSSGSDWQEIRLRAINADGSTQDYADVIQWTKFTNIAWKADNSGFYYSRFPQPGTVAPEDGSNYSQVYWHQLGTDQTQDQLIFERPDFKELGFTPVITDDHKYLCLQVWLGTDTNNRFYYREVDSTQPFVRLLDQAEARYDLVGNVGSIFYFNTNLQAPRGRIVAVDVSRVELGSTAINWQEIIKEQADVLSSATIINHHLVVEYMHDVHDVLKIYEMNGSLVRDLELPTLGTIAELSGKAQDNEMFFSFESFLYPTSVFRYDFSTRELKLFRRPQVDFQASNFETTQVFYQSKDGTRIPMFLTYKKGLELNGQNPTILYGYGGFNISVNPSFRAWRIAWLENGGVFAVANLRGGGEYGEEWHEAGMLAKKQNVFDDFIAAGEWLVSNKYSSRKRLAIMGGSNGGLLVAACIVQRPDLFGAAICQVPVIDMLRYHKFTVGRYWVPEYGNAENADQFGFMYAYSPLHNIKAGVAYPPLLIATADTDDRVVPAHAKKFAATLQEAAGGESSNPLLIRIETKAGHGAGKPTAKLIDEISDELSFLYRVFGVTI